FFQKRIACTTGAGLFCESLRACPYQLFFLLLPFEFQSSAASLRTARGHSGNSSGKPTEGGTRCPQRVGRSYAVFFVDPIRAILRERLAPWAIGIVFGEADPPVAQRLHGRTRWQTTY